VRQGRLASRNDAQDQTRRHAEGRGAFRGVEDAQPAAAAGADVEQAAAALHAFHDSVHRLGNTGDFRADSGGDLAILRVNDGQNCRRTEGINALGGGVGLLCEEIP